MAATATGLRERKKLATREALAAAALRLAAERGLDQVTVEDIAAEADVSVRTFFNYFSAKEQAIVSPNVHRVDALADDLLSRPAAETPLEALEAAMATAADRYASQAEEWSVREQLIRDHPALGRWNLDSFARLERRLVEAMGARLGVDPDADPYPSLVVNAALTTFRMAVAWWRTPGCHADLRDVLHDSFAVLASGLAPPARRRRRPSPPRTSPSRTSPR